MKRSVRACYEGEGYVFAKNAAEITKEFGLARIARLASNENPDPPSQEAVKRGYEALQRANRYPDERMVSLSDALRTRYGNYSFVTGVGMDGVIETTIRTLVDPGIRLLSPPPRSLSTAWLHWPRAERS